MLPAAVQVFHCLDPEDPAVRKVSILNTAADEQDVRGPLLATVLKPVSEVAAKLGYSEYCLHTVVMSWVALCKNAAPWLQPMTHVA